MNALSIAIGVDDLVSTSYSLSIEQKRCSTSDAHCQFEVFDQEVNKFANVWGVVQPPRHLIMYGLCGGLTPGRDGTVLALGHFVQSPLDHAGHCFSCFFHLNGHRHRYECHRS
jgi:hypothetical protein